MKELCLPSFDYKVKKQQGQTLIFDVVRKRYVVLTPEEWVRQHFIHFLVTYRGFPVRLIAVEKEVEVCGLKQRFDLVCYDRQGKPYLIVECKAPTVPLSQVVFDQAFRYNLSVAARFVAITNGCELYCGEMTEEREFRLLTDIPYFNS
ncbi:type I restriction enzyme HsdR N-terminal domain-containing protein [uncultured Sanguibacteroides sp.]|uniref:type I restriction enzyme HsdR N-terminal domain-containing protein n=1 Tax=uncultured Sanguibacteroides sp. TaxID=1635151 RepID=UPI0025F3B746|nr:type I restriction enzyme HsdR N-terminal domain-containing protein [uncultured Sanguibacteroides sp.]